MQPSHLLIVVTWSCSPRESNPHARRPSILNRLRLPFHQESVTISYLFRSEQRDSNPRSQAGDLVPCLSVMLASSFHLQSGGTFTHCLGKPTRGRCPHGSSFQGDVVTSMERKTGLEPVASSLEARRSAIELHSHTVVHLQAPVGVEPTRPCGHLF